MKLLMFQYYFESTMSYRKYLSGSQIGLLGGSLKNTGHWQCQCRWRKILSYLCIHV